MYIWFTILLFILVLNSLFIIYINYIAHFHLMSSFINSNPFQDIKKTSYTISICFTNLVDIGELVHLIILFEYN